ncbi:MAG: putative rane protein [Fusobacteriaceae bacterium]|jgi:putative membrane protein|nr:hypothetical protein [Fusobacteriales bacterium]MDN5303474.1 putative rane protein [Fusobacteriaceae bacterium]
MEYIKNILKGSAIGAANIIPGVSGGTLAFILGIYDKLTEAIGEFFEVDNKKRIEFIKFLVQIGIGVIIGILIFSKIIEYMYNNYSEATNFFFIGLIIPSVFFIFKKEKVKLKSINFIFLLAGIIIVTALGYFKGFQRIESSIINMSMIYLIKLFFCGIIAAGTMVMPGVSGSLILLLLGEYHNVIGFVNNLEILPLSVIAIGAVLGIVIFARVIDFLLKKYREQTILFIIGLILASIIEIYPGITFSMIILDIIAIILGSFIVYKIS